MRKKLIAVFAVAALLGAVFAFAACDEEETFSGTDEAGRTYGQVYALTQESADGWFRVPAESFSESTMGKMMVDNTRKDYVTVIKEQDSYTLIYHATSDDMNNVRLVIDGADMSAEASTVGEISVKVYVATMMKRDTNFTIKLDMTQAMLVPEESFEEK